MPLLLLGLIAFVVILAFVLAPVSLVMRYRVGTARRLARGWLATLNATMFTLSALLLVMTSAITSVWVPYALVSTIGGLLAGCLLGAFGLMQTRWEVHPGTLHFTPNRWLVLGLTLVVSARLVYGLWRGWHSWRTPMEGSSWVADAGVGGSLAAAAVVMGYYAIYWAGVRRRMQRRVVPVR